MVHEIQIKPWLEIKELSIPIRFEVFVNEQNVPADMELDEGDSSAWHALVFDDNEPIGTARLVIEEVISMGLKYQVGRIGRMAILKKFRSQGIGQALLKELINFALGRGIHEFYLHAQLSAQVFYKKMGFVSEGEIFEEAGILHQSMRLKI